MFINTKGIVLHKTKYGDHSMIVKIYTEKVGTLSFIVKGAYSKKSKINQSLFGLLSILELNFDNHRPTQLHYIKDASIAYHYTTIPFDAARSSILFFYNELLYKLLFNAGEDPSLFHFIEQSLRELDEPECRTADVHIQFMIRLAQILGFLPENNYSERTPFFSIEESCFTDFYIDNASLTQAESQYFAQAIQAVQEGKELPLAEKTTRINLLRGLINYFEKHDESFSNMQSMNVLCDVLN